MDYNKSIVPSELPRLRSGFRLQAQTPANWLNFDCASLPAVALSPLKMTGIGCILFDYSFCIR